MADSVYLETSAIIALFDEREDPVGAVQHQPTRKWYDQQVAHYDMVAPVVVVEELRCDTYDHQVQTV